MSHQHASSSSLVEQLREEFPILSSCLLPSLSDKADDADFAQEDPAVPSEQEQVDLVLRDAISDHSFDQILASLQRLGQSTNSISSLFLYKDFLLPLSQEQQTQLYDTLGQFLGEHLEEVSLSFVKLSVATLANLLRHCPNLKRLYLGRVSLLQRQDAPQLYQALSTLTQLEDMHWSVAPGRPSTLPFLQLDPNHLQAAHTSLDQLLTVLATLPQLKSLYLSAHKPRAGRIVASSCLEQLASSRNLQNLTVVNCPLSASHVRALLMKDDNNQWQSLALLQADLGDEGMEVLVESLANCSQLQKLYLASNNITDRTGIKLAKALPSTLTVLDLHDNHLTSAFCQALATVLPSSKLEFLELSHNPLGDAGGQALAQALTSDAKLQQLNLFSSGISDVTCRSLARALQGNTHLKNINLYHNPNITAKGISTLMQPLEHDNYHLQRLEVSEPPLLDCSNPTKEQSSHDQLEFYLKLNRHFERQSLLGDTTITDAKYVDKSLGKALASQDLNSLFYFLQAKPSLCAVADSSGGNTDNTETNKKGPAMSVSDITSAAFRILDDTSESFA